MDKKDKTDVVEQLGFVLMVLLFLGLLFFSPMT